MTAEQAMERAYKCHGHEPNILCNICTRIGMEVLEAHKIGVLEGIDIMSEKALAGLAEPR